MAPSESQPAADGGDRSHLPVGFQVRIVKGSYPYDDGVVHNDEDPCGHAPAPRKATRTDLATMPSEGKRLCEFCNWPPGARDALEEGN